MRIILGFLLAILISGNAFANYVIGNWVVTGVGSTTTGLVSGNVGIGTTVPGATFDVEGTLSTANFGGNVGIGSLSPGTALDVNGTVRVKGFLNTNLPTSGGATYACFNSLGQLVSQSGAC